MIYRLPTIEDEVNLIEYVAEHQKHGEKSISASLGLPIMDYQEWVAMVQKNASIGSEDWGKSLHQRLSIPHRRIFLHNLSIFL